MAIPNGIIVGWPSTVVSIPGGWSRVAALNAKFLKGTAAGVDPGGTGGAATHTHTTAAHSHAESGSHVHAINNSGNSAGTVGGDAGGTLYATAGHAHVTNGNTGASATAIPNDTPDTSDNNNEPVYYTVIWVSSDGTPAGLPNGCLAFWNTDTSPAGWTFCNGGGGTLDLRNAFLKGAALGADGGAGPSGAATHTHTIAAHTHSNWSHTHAGTTSAAGTTGANIHGSGAGISVNNFDHTHALAHDAGTGAVAVNTNSASGTSNNDPPYYNAPILKNTSGVDDIPDGIICVWIGTLAALSALSEWKLCDGSSGTPDLRSKYIKQPNTIAGVGGSGGSLTSSHTTAAHDHTVASHTHTITVTAGATIAAHAGTSNVAVDTHTHTWTNANATAALGSTAVTINDNTTVEPEYYGVAYAMKVSAGPAGPTYKMDAGRESLHGFRRRTKFHHTMMIGSV